MGCIQRKRDVQGAVGRVSLEDTVLPRGYCVSGAVGGTYQHPGFCHNWETGMGVLVESQGCHQKSSHAQQRMIQVQVMVSPWSRTQMPCLGFATWTGWTGSGAGQMFPCVQRAGSCHTTAISSVTQQRRAEATPSQVSSAHSPRAGRTMLQAPGSAL